MSSNKPILVLGIGNILMSDEGIGVRVIEALQEHDLGAAVELFDGGTSGADLLDVLSDRQLVIVVDAVETGSAVGTVVRMDAEQLAANAPDALSLHELGIAETLAMTRCLGCAPERAVVLGIEPGTIRLGLELTPAVRRAIPAVIDLIRNEMRQWEASSGASVGGQQMRGSSSP